MLSYCHAPAHSCSRLIPCEDRALTIRGFPRPAARREGCKVFFRADPSPACPRVALGVLPSRGTEAHSVLLLKTSLAPDGRERLQPQAPRQQNCPPETGGTRSEATEGVDDTNGLAKLDEFATALA